MTQLKALPFDPPAPRMDEERSVELGDLRFRRLVGAKAWEALAPAMRARFAKRLSAGKSAIYKGEIVHTRMNLAGRIVANALRLLGAPLPLDPTEGGLAAVVTVTEDPVSHGQFWTRQYNRARGFPQVIHSTKAFAGPTGLEEYVTHWLGMSLTLEAEANCLSFRGDRYFLKLIGRRVFLPGWLSPGGLTVSHHDLGAGIFVFTLILEHRALGRLLDQRAVFSDVRDT